MEQVGKGGPGAITGAPGAPNQLPATRQQLRVPWVYAARSIWCDRYPS